MCEYIEQNDSYPARKQMRPIEYNADCYAAYNLKAKFGYLFNELSGLSEILESTTGARLQKRVKAIEDCFALDEAPVFKTTNFTVN